MRKVLTLFLLINQRFLLCFAWRFPSFFNWPPKIFLINLALPRLILFSALAPKEAVSGMLHCFSCCCYFRDSNSPHFLRNFPVTAIWGSHIFTWNMFVHPTPCAIIRPGVLCFYFKEKHWALTYSGIIISVNSSFYLMFSKHVQTSCL